MSIQSQQYIKAVRARKQGGKEVRKICDSCGYEWRGYPNSRCPNCGYHPGKGRK